MARRFFFRYRLPLLALALSAVLHAAVMVGMPKRVDAIDEGPLASYAATLDPAAIVAEPAPAPVAAPAPAPRPRPPRAKAARPAPVVMPMPLLQPLAQIAAVQPLVIPDVVVPDAPPEPEVVAMAVPVAPPPAPEPFPVEGFPANLSIDYQLTSSFADGRAVYRWSRDGDEYRITGEAQAEGFFALFLEGQILQETRGHVTRQGLRPEAFSERKPNAAPEGLEFDWNARTVVFDRNGAKKSASLEENTVDWLSMIFQLAHRPPQGEATEMRVYTQRRMYSFKLQVLGTEEIEIPLGKVRAVHLRHVDPKDATDVVDVWLGVDQHYVPVKMRYPVAKNRLTVEQVATRVDER